ncbi:hypothetical protein OEZ86_005268 [Tetradesmus obliquus]|nr:hypothetical protein OEZ86_005268 [Tetradesmus obliquus]
MHVLLCAGGAGKQRQLFTITRAAAWGGQNCSEAAGTERFIDCNNTACCPVNCVASWVTTGNCTGACSGGAGLLRERYIITGTECPEVHGTTNDGGAGFIPETFILSQPAMYGGTACSATNGTVRNAIACINNTPCLPVDCVGNWIANGNCTGGCGNVRLGGLLPERYVITTPAARNGTDCPAEAGDTRMSTPCTNKNPCRPVACNATWVSAGPCNGACNNGTGTRPEMYVIYAPPVDNGANCTHPNGTIR